MVVISKSIPAPKLCPTSCPRCNVQGNPDVIILIWQKSKILRTKILHKNCDDFGSQWSGQISILTNYTLELKYFQIWTHNEQSTNHCSDTSKTRQLSTLSGNQLIDKTSAPVSHQVSNSLHNGIYFAWRGTNINIYEQYASTDLWNIMIPIGLYCIKRLPKYLLRRLFPVLSSFRPCQALMK